VYKIDDNPAEHIQKIMKRAHEIRFVLQPFLKFDSGHQYQNIISSIDIRLIYIHSQLVQCYVRIAQPNSFLCNEHQGGELEYVTSE
jgi:hypothetical protein